MARPPDFVDRFSDRLARLPLVKPRQPEDLPVHIDRRRIYVLPTGFGLFLSLMLVAMVLGGLNYNNNPALLLAFVTIAVAHNSLVQAHLTLSGLRLVALHAEPVFAGQSLAVRAAFEATGRAYLYRIVNRRAPLTVDHGRAWRIGTPLDATAMHEAAQLLAVGDFPLPAGTDAVRLAAWTCVANAILNFDETITKE